MKRIPVEYAILALAIAATVVIAFPAQAEPSGLRVPTLNAGVAHVTPSPRTSVHHD